MATLIDRPRTFAEFEKYRQELFSSKENQRYSKEHPFSFAVERCNHQIQKLEELIKNAEGVAGKTIKGKIAGWKRQLARRIEARNRVLQLSIEALSEPKSPLVSSKRF